MEVFISKLGWIPARNPNFLYMRDRNLFRIGDAVGLSIVSLAVGFILDHTRFPPVWYSAVVLVFTLVLTGVMHYRVWLKQSKRDSVYPPGGVSLLGIAHLPYFAGHVTWVVLGMWHITDLSILGFVFLGVLGGAVWVVTLVRDGKQNKEG